ncbi:Uncharacterised protein [Mycobacterium tuberculosis]|uniref:Uncharacterized protein n=1 Tax=Mycobacterium tuberculosis TaxID=1773 RepID=A0A0U0UAH7_MYCTX|nr:hypothetical protein CAB90_02091 [Mycobacterium tuberculosis]CKP63592.1 Uncharacterised protein [Mycobacterium tuberculosis]CKR54836.1 Uncharacterised protein [Mycobacterium tuberculosis]CKS22506.1 Uncharacterised protein [Mycobacterium tuberculosis]CKT50467.1 Uncharacterised protein [Mycobacterium tuberculosis]
MLGHAQNFADDHDRQLRAIASYDVHNPGLLSEPIQEIDRGLFDQIA